MRHCRMKTMSVCLHDVLLHIRAVLSIWSATTAVRCCIMSLAACHCCCAAHVVPKDILAQVASLPSLQRLEAPAKALSDLAARLQVSIDEAISEYQSRFSRSLRIVSAGQGNDIQQDGSTSINAPCTMAVSLTPAFASHKGLMA